LKTSVPPTRWPVLLALALTLACAPHQHTTPRHVADGTIVSTGDSTFVRDVIAHGRPTVVYYWAVGCIPCYGFAPHVRKLAARYAGSVTFWKMDMGWSAERVQRYGIPGWPALGFYAGDREIARMSGVPEKNVDDSLAAFVESGLRMVQTGVTNVHCSDEALPRTARPTDAVYERATDLEARVRHAHIELQCVQRSMMGGLFEGLDGAALFRTKDTDFAALFLPVSLTFDQLHVHERAHNGTYIYSFSGPPRPCSPDGIESPQRMYFVRHQDALLIAYDPGLAHALANAVGGAEIPANR